jgi:hypothetical protein
VFFQIWSNISKIILMYISESFVLFFYFLLLLQMSCKTYENCEVNHAIFVVVVLLFIVVKCCVSKILYCISIWSWTTQSFCSHSYFKYQQHLFLYYFAKCFVYMIYLFFSSFIFWETRNKDHSMTIFIKSIIKFQFILGKTVFHL